MADKNDAERTVGEIKGTAATMNSPRSESHAVTPDAPHVTPTTGVSRHLAGCEDTREVPAKNAELPHVGHGTQP